MANAAGVRPDKTLAKMLYKVLKTPKTLQMNDKNFSERSVMAWTKESFPYQSGNQ